MPPLPTERAILGVPGPVFFGLLVLLAIAAFVYSMSRRVRVLLATSPENRFDRIGARIIGEGLDTIEELQTLGRIGIHFGQGWLFGKPHRLRSD